MVPGARSKVQEKVRREWPWANLRLRVSRSSALKWYSVVFGWEHLSPVGPVVLHFYFKPKMYYAVYGNI